MHRGCATVLEELLVCSSAAMGEICAKPPCLATAWGISSQKSLLTCSALHPAYEGRRQAVLGWAACTHRAACTSGDRNGFWMQQGHQVASVAAGWKGGWQWPSC